MKRLLILGFLLTPSLAFAQRFGTIKSSNDVSLSSNTILHSTTPEAKTVDVASVTVNGPLTVFNTTSGSYSIETADNPFGPKGTTKQIKTIPAFGSGGRYRIAASTQATLPATQAAGQTEVIVNAPNGSSDAEVLFYLNGNRALDVSQTGAEFPFSMTTTTATVSQQVAITDDDTTYPLTVTRSGKNLGYFDFYDNSASVTSDRAVLFTQLRVGTVQPEFDIVASTQSSVTSGTHLNDAVIRLVPDNGNALEPSYIRFSVGQFPVMTFSSGTVDYNSNAITNPGPITQGNINVISGTVGSETGNYNYHGTTITYGAPPIDSLDRIPILNNGAVSWPLAVTDGLRAGGVDGSTYSVTAAMVFSGSVTVPSGSSPPVDGAGKIGFDTTDNSLIGHDGNRQFIVARSTVPLFDVAISSGTGWDSLAYKVYTAPTDMAVTVTNCWASVQDGTSVTFNFEERARTTPGTSGTALTSSAIVADTDGTLTNVFSNAGISATNQIFFVTSTSAASGSVSTINLTCEGTLDVE